MKKRNIFIAIFSFLIALILFSANTTNFAFAQTKQYVGHVKSSNSWYNGNVLINFINIEVTDEDFKLDESYKIYRVDENGKIDYENENVLLMNTETNVYITYESNESRDNWLITGLVFEKDNEKFYVQSFEQYAYTKGYEAKAEEPTDFELFFEENGVWVIIVAAFIVIVIIAVVVKKKKS